ncbi:hypothetical protein BDQ17DRAFT_1436067 [Cyathus striatus]|nr:hypothetical protein BDQ17DRAFT_1436067 [Cyathus striatus]
MSQPLPISKERSTYVPSPSEISTIQNSVECSEMAMRSMEAQLLVIRKFCALQRSLLAPIRKLPGNVLGEIFIHVIGGDAIDIGARDGQIWTLLQVCARWRKVVGRTPALWSKFHVGKKVRQATISHRIDMCLSLSRMAPLSVSLYPHTNRVLLLQGIQRINQHANRIWCLSVSTDFLHWIKAPQIPKVGSALRKLIVKGRSTHVDAFRWFWKATELEEVRLELQGRINLKSTIENQIRLRSIKRLTLKRCRINGGDTVLALLKAMHSLEELIWIDNTFTINHVPDIEKLTLRMPATGSLTEVLEYLSREKNPDKLPLLKELRIEIVKGFSPSVKDYLVEEEPVHLSYIKLSMEVPQSYYEEYTSPDTNLRMDDIKALAGELTMVIDFDIRVAELGEGVTGAEGREEEVSQIVEEMRKVSDGEDEGIWS